MFGTSQSVPCVSIHVQFLKNDQKGKVTNILLSSFQQSDICPVSNFKTLKFLCVRPSDERSLDAHGDKSPPTRFQFNALLRKSLLKFTHFPLTNYIFLKNLWWNVSHPKVGIAWQITKAVAIKRSPELYHNKYIVRVIFLVIY